MRQLQIDCGIDIGSTNLKIIFVTGEGQVLHVCSVPTPRIHDDSGPVTDSLALVDLLEDMIIEGWNKVAEGLPLRSITAVGVGEDGVAVRSDLRPTGLAIPWFDNRATEEAVFLERYSTYSGRTGIAFGPDRTAAKWLWTHRYRPEEFQQAETWIALTDFPAAFWTGRPFMSASLAPRTACFDVYRRRWIDELLEVTHAPVLPEILGGGTVVGAVKNGRLLQHGAASEQTVVAAGGHDHPAAATVIRGYDSIGIVDSLGTANLLYGESNQIDEGAASVSLAFSLPPDGGQGVACLGVVEVSAAFDSVGASSREIRSYLSNEILPGQPPKNVCELSELQKSQDMRIRRVLERESLRARAIIEEMTSFGVPSGTIYATGGLSRSRGLMELRASIFGQPINVIDDMELSALGAAQFGAKASTGSLACYIRTNDISCVNPLPDWVLRYDALFAERGDVHWGFQGESK